MYSYTLQPDSLANIDQAPKVDKLAPINVGWIYTPWGNLTMVSLASISSSARESLKMPARLKEELANSGVPDSSANSSTLILVEVLFISLVEVLPE